MANIFDSAKTIQEKRIILKQLSDPLKDLVKIGQFDTINDGLKAVYAQSGHVVLKTMKQWNKEGKRVIKGQHALCLWGQPKKREQTESEAEKEATDPRDFYPLCYVFSNLQVNEKQ